MSGVHVGQIATALGEHVRPVEDVQEAGLLFSSAAALREAGFASHHHCGPDTTSYDLARRAVAAIPGELGRIDAIVYATCLPLNGSIDDRPAYERSRDVKHLMRYPASLLQADFGLHDAVAVGLNQQACTGMLGALRLAGALLTVETGWQRVLCVTADRFPAGAVYEQAYNLISDGAAACVVTRDPGPFRLLASHQITNGGMVLQEDDEVVGSFFNYSYRVLCETLAKAGRTPADVDWVVPQNTNRRAWDILSRALDLSPDRICTPTMAEAGHVISGDNVLNLQHLADSGAVRSGDVLLLLMAGYGMNWQCTLLEAS